MNDPQHEKANSSLTFEELATIDAYTMPFEADIARSVLESGEIPAFLADYHIIYMNWLYSNALGGIKLQVRKGDVAIAREILNKALRAGQEETYSEGLCPICHSNMTAPIVRGRRWIILAWLVTGIPMGWLWTKLRCSSCGHSWRS